MKKPSLAALTLCFCLATSLASTEQGAFAKPPVFVLPTNSVEIGTINGYEFKNAVFHIANAGESPLNITNIIPTCNCISGTVNKPILQPKEEGLITLRLDAKLVHDTFKRSVWVESNDPKNPRLLLTVKGTTMPEFMGLPPMPIALRASDATAVWTNSLTLTASETNLFLGTPTIKSNDFANIDVTVITNAAEKMSYTVITVIKPFDSESHITSVTFPVIGRPGTEPGPVRLQFQMKVGAKLNVTPNRLLLNPTGKTAPKRLVVHTSERVANTNLLSWTPAREGVSITVQPPKGIRSNILLMIEVSEAAAQRLLKETNPVMTFNYPNHKPTTFSFSDMSQGKNAAP